MIDGVPDDGGGLARTLKLGPWQHAISDAMRFAELAAVHCDPACREAIVLAAAELAENVVKYGVRLEEPLAGAISVSVQGNVARICSTNAVASADDAQSVIDIVARMAAASSGATELYRARLQELFMNPAMPRAQLGLLRLAFEGDFRLSASFDPPMLRIVAERPCRGHRSR
jgi:hypothetical protein